MEEGRKMGRRCKRARLKDLRKLFERMDTGAESAVKEFDEYGLAFDYVPGDNGHPGFWRYQLSTNPEEEFRFYSTPREKPYKITFVNNSKEYLLRGPDLDLLLKVWDQFQDTKVITFVYNKAIDNR